MTPEWVAERARAEAGDPAPLRALRMLAAQRLAQTGFPGPRDEAWKYTRSAPYQRVSFAPASLPPEALPSDDTLAWPGERVVFVDGRWSAERSALSGAVPARSIRESADQIGLFYRDTGGFLSANLALAVDGLSIDVPEGMSLELHLLHLTSRPSRLSSVRHTIRLGEGSTLVLSERYLGGGEGMTSAVCEISLAQGATLRHLRLQDEATDHLHFGAVGVLCGPGARYELSSLVLGGSTSRVELSVRLSGEGASCELSGLAMLRGSQHADHHVTVDHERPDCVSRQQFRSLLEGRSRGVFTGNVMVREGARGTDAAQSHRALLLSDEAQANTRPQLQIDNDEVKCSHGAAVGALDPEALFYLQARGLSPESARALLVGAFLSEIVQNVPVAAAREALEARVTRALEVS